MLGLRVSAVVFFCSIVRDKIIKQQVMQVHGVWGAKDSCQKQNGEKLGNWAGEELKWGRIWGTEPGRNWNGFLDWRERHPCPSFGESLPTTTPRKGWLNVARLALHHITPHHSSHMCSIRHHHPHHQLHAGQSNFRMRSSHHYYHPFYQLSSALWADWWPVQKTDASQSHERKLKKLKIAFQSFSD